jgi:DNA-binding response OmpR family regulator
MTGLATDTNRRRILLVDDDPTLRETLAEQLGFHEEYTVSEAENGSEAMKLADADHFDAIVLDVGLPDMDGRDLCKLMRRRGLKAPIIMLTGQDSDADAILGLDAGANDYITKPFRFNVFMARLRAQMRTHEQSDDAVFTVGP